MAGLGVPLAYSFSLLGTSASAMLLIPTHVESPAGAQALYHISIGHDPFIPTHLVTSVVKGSNDQGLTAISIPNHPQQPVFINGSEYKLMDIFQKRKKKKGSCHDPADSNRIFAEFCVSAGLATNSPRAEPQLIVMPIGQTLLDDIIISILLLERQRLTAALDTNEVHLETRKTSSPDRIVE
ncbi:hypothetical protein CVT25_002549 [Psilocybe cyanescens]|uniref:Uncharacterized protein n=1 Tax=Psilocybe cyanescens TaxID=93625 RepID=A0A409XUQ2_PSICY|nr:hypothetical protein CVT25_002549 [Psilocybe cyanescens]